MSFLRFLNPDNYSKKAKTWKKSREDDVMSVLSLKIPSEELDDCLSKSIFGMMNYLINARHKWSHTKQEDWVDLKKKTIDVIEGGQKVTREKRALTGEVETYKSELQDIRNKIDKLCAESDKKIGENKHEEFTTVNKNLDAEMDEKISNTTHEENHATASGTDEMLSLQHSLIVDKHQIEQLA